MIQFIGGRDHLLVELGLVQKLRLLVGHPGYTIAVVLASLILFAGVGSVISGSVFGNGVLTFRRGAILAALMICLALAGAEWLLPAVVGWPRVLKLAVAFLIPALPGIALGQLYPQGLARLSRTAAELIPWAMAVNATTGTIAAALGVVLGHAVGFRGVIGLGAAVYLAIALLPNRFQDQLPESETQSTDYTPLTPAEGRNA